ncbi:hypothetical protein OC834_003681 [Tilletia horrida]|nr:hypothetical protein OC834_003681 [Tilletia horrida]
MLAEYPYPRTNSELIKDLNLEPHPEGGYYSLTWLGEEKTPTPFVFRSPARPLASTIYYLLAARSDAESQADVEKLRASGLAVPADGSGEGGLKWSPHSAVFHLNRSATMHLHHAGRAKYTLIEAHPAKGRRPRIKEVIVGADSARGEVRQLLVEGGEHGWWKMSQVPERDVRHAAEAEEGQRERVGCLISEVVIPGFDWKDHRYMQTSDLRRLFPGQDDEDKAALTRFSPHVEPDEE